MMLKILNNNGIRNNLRYFQKHHPDIRYEVFSSAQTYFDKTLFYEIL